MVRRAHHERSYKPTVRPELVEGQFTRPRHFLCKAPPTTAALPYPEPRWATGIPPLNAGMTSLPFYLTPIDTLVRLPLFPPLRMRRGAGGEVCSLGNSAIYLTPIDTLVRLPLFQPTPHAERGPRGEVSSLGNSAIYLTPIDTLVRLPLFQPSPHAERGPRGEVSSLGNSAIYLTPIDTLVRLPLFPPLRTLYRPGT